MQWLVLTVNLELKSNLGDTPLFVFVKTFPERTDRAKIHPQTESLADRDKGV